MINGGREARSTFLGNAAHGFFVFFLLRVPRRAQIKHVVNVSVATNG
jgi:hypothetical protein